VYLFAIQLVVEWDGHWVGWVNHSYFIQSNRKVLLYAVQSFVQPVIHTVIQPAVASYMQTVFCWTSQLYNWLYHVNRVLGIHLLRSINEGVWKVAILHKGMAVSCDLCMVDTKLPQTTNTKSYLPTLVAFPMILSDLHSWFLGFLGHAVFKHQMYWKHHLKPQLPLNYYCSALATSGAMFLPHHTVVWGIVSLLFFCVFFYLYGYGFLSGGKS